MLENKEQSIHLEQTPSQKLAEHLQAIRQQKAWTQDEVAGHLKIRPEVISRFESPQIDFAGLNTFERGYLRNYMDLLGVPLSEFEALFADSDHLGYQLAKVTDESAVIHPIISTKMMKVALTILIVFMIVVLVAMNL